MAYRGSFYYDDYDYENYPETFVDYEQRAYDEIGDQETPQLSDVLVCGVSVSHQIATQLLILLCVNLIYRFVRQSSKFSNLINRNTFTTYFCVFTFIVQYTNFPISFSNNLLLRLARLFQASVFKSTRILLNIHLLFQWKLLHLFSGVCLFHFSQTLAIHQRQKARISHDSSSDCSHFYLVSDVVDHQFDRRIFFLTFTFLQLSFTTLTKTYAARLIQWNLRMGNNKLATCSWLCLDHFNESNLRGFWR